MRVVQVKSDGRGLYVRHRAGYARPLAPKMGGSSDLDHLLGAPLICDGATAFGIDQRLRKVEVIDERGVTRLESMDGKRAEWWWIHPTSQVARGAPIPIRVQRVDASLDLRGLREGHWPDAVDAAERERAQRALDAYTAKVRCTRCGQRYDPQIDFASSAWRWTGAAWEHKCQDDGNTQTWQGCHWPAEPIIEITLDDAALRQLLDVAYAAAMGTPDPYQTVKDFVECEIAHPISGGSGAALAIPGVREAALAWADAVDHA